MEQITEISNDNGVRWVEITGLEFSYIEKTDVNTFGITDDNRILDCDGCPLTEGDGITVTLKRIFNVD